MIKGQTVYVVQVDGHGHYVAFKSIYVDKNAAHDGEHYVRQNRKNADDKKAVWMTVARPSVRIFQDEAAAWEKAASLNFELATAAMRAHSDCLTQRDKVLKRRKKAK